MPDCERSILKGKSCPRKETTRTRKLTSKRCAAVEFSEAHKRDIALQENTSTMVCQ
jgi:hypothetical protein